MSQTKKKYQQEPILYAFELPKDLLETLEPVEKKEEEETLLAIEQESHSDVNALALERLQIQQERLNNEDSRGCNTCNTTFNDREEQRAHFNTDWHRYNIKRRVVLEVEPVTFEAFEVLLADLTESISGSEDDEEDQEEDLQKDDIHSLVERQKKQQEEKANLENEAKQVVMPIMKKYSALTWFKQSNLKSSSHYGIYRHLLDDDRTLNSIQKPNFLQKKRSWTILMLGGGHFAGCVIDVNLSKGAGEKSVDRQVQFIAHKTFHRYTTRRKQGGSQSANDNAKGAALSAGAQIRRYNEQLLQQEVRDILGQWRQHILNSELVFVHAPSGNRKILFNYEGAVLEQAKVKSIPFATRRPTLGELKRVYLELTTLKVIQVDEEAIQAYKQKWIEQQEKQKKILEKSSTSNVKKSKEVIEKNVDPDLIKLLAVVKQNKTQVTLSFIEKHGKLDLSQVLPKELEDTEDLYHYPTLLHLVSSLGGADDLVRELLIRYDVDPTVVSDAGKTAYEVSKDKETRNAYRRCMNDYPDKWDWLQGARVPSPLTEKQLKDQLIKQEKKLAKEQEKKRMIELERERIQQEREAKEEEEKMKKVQQTRAKNYMLPIVTAPTVDLASMTPEARMRFEREKRARAAEERMKKFK